MKQYGNKINQLTTNKLLSLFLTGFLRGGATGVSTLLVGMLSLGIAPLANV